MAPVITADSFLDVVKRSRLISADALDRALNELDEQGADLVSPKEIADALVAQGQLTRWQADYLLQGKHKGFFLGPYRFLKLLGKGGMGAVYLAEHKMMRRRCAIKVLTSKLLKGSSSVLERFYLEAQAVASLDDPNIVRAYDVNKEGHGKNEIHYLVMEYVEGKDLQVTVEEKKGGLDYLQAAEFMRQAACGLAHAHENGLIHRDIKPANLLVDGKGTVKILDLGLARFFDDSDQASLTATYNESILGTADYLSPEQALNSHDVDTRTDIYSLGCTFYFTLTGRPPFPDGSVAQRLISHQVKSPKSIESFRDDVPVDLAAIVDKMIAKSPEDRFQTAEDAAAALRAWLVEHADEAWRQSHRDILGEGSGITSRSASEPTLANSSPTAETELELGLTPIERDDPMADEAASQSGASAANGALDSNVAAPTKTGGETSPLQPIREEDVFAQLEDVAKSLESGSLSQPYDDLLSGPLDDLAPTDPSVDLAGSSNNSLSGSNPSLSTSGVQRAVRAAEAPSESKQLIWLLLIGFGVSVPLAVVILVVALVITAPQVEEVQMAEGGIQQSVPVGSESAIDEPAPSPGRPDSEPTQEASGEPAKTATDETPQEDVSQGIAPTLKRPNADVHEVRKPAIPDDQHIGNPPADPPPGESQVTTRPPKKRRGNRKGTNDRQQAPPESQGREPEPVDISTNDADNPPAETEAASKPLVKEFSAEEKRRIFAGIREVYVTLDHKPNSRVDLILLRLAEEALTREGLHATFDAPEKALSILTVSLRAEKSDQYVLLNMTAELKCRVEGEEERVSVWQRSEQISRVAPQVLRQNNVPSTVRNSVGKFYDRFTREYNSAAAAYRQRQ